jgi:hypothetical protein
VSKFEAAKRLAGELHAIAWSLSPESEERRTMRESADLLESLVNAERLYEEAAFAWTAEEAKLALVILKRIDKRLVKFAPMRAPVNRREFAQVNVGELDVVSIEEIERRISEWKTHDPSVPMDGDRNEGV